MPKIISDPTARLKAEARRQIAEVGYNALNIRSIAKNCGIGIGTFYNYFASKDALIAAFLFEDWTKVTAVIKEVADRKEPEALIRAVYSGLCGFIDENSELFRSASETVQAVPHKYHVILRNQLADILEPFTKERFDAEFIAEALLDWSTEGIPFERISGIIFRII